MIKKISDQFKISDKVKLYDQSDEVKNLNDLLSCNTMDKIKDFLKVKIISVIEIKDPSASHNFHIIYDVEMLKDAQRFMKAHKIQNAGLTDAIAAALLDKKKAQLLVTLAYIYHRNMLNYSALEIDCVKNVQEKRTFLTVDGVATECRQINPYLLELLNRSQNTGNYVALKYVANVKYIEAGAFTIHVYNTLKHLSKIKKVGISPNMHFEYFLSVFTHVTEKIRTRNKDKLIELPEMIEAATKKVFNFEVFLKSKPADRLAILKTLQNEIYLKKVLLYITAIKCNKITRHKVLCQIIKENFTNKENAAKLVDAIIPNFYGIFAKYLTGIKESMIENMSGQGKKQKSSKKSNESKKEKEKIYKDAIKNMEEAKKQMES